MKIQSVKEPDYVPTDGTVPDMCKDTLCFPKFKPQLRSSHERCVSHCSPGHVDGLKQ